MPCLRLYITIMKNNFPQWDSNPTSLTLQQGVLPWDQWNQTDGVLVISKSRFHYRVFCHFFNFLAYFLFAFSTLTLLVGHPEEHLTCKKTEWWLSVWSKVQTIYIWSSWCHCHPTMSCSYKLAVLTYKVCSTGTPSSLSHHIKPRISTHHLRSSSHQLLQKPTTRTHFADRAFRCTAPIVWNSLNSYTVDSGSLAVFKSRLKTFLFRRTFNPA